MIYLLNESDYLPFLKLLTKVDSDFLPTLSSRVDLDHYALKLLKVATVFGVYQQKKLVGAIAVYMNDLDSKLAYCSFIATLSDYRGQGFSKQLIETVIIELKSKKFQRLELTVRADSPASNLYNKVGFKTVGEFKYEESAIKGLKMELQLL